MAADKPDAADLLEVGRELLLQELLPALPQTQRYAGSMLANALAIASREFRAGSKTGEKVAKAIRNVYEEEVITDLEHRLAADIRDGRLPDTSPELRDLLMQQTVARLRLSNPKHLQGHGLEAGNG